MKKILLPALFFAGWMALLNTDLPVKGSFMPALGRFLSPFIGVWQNVTPNAINPQLKANVRHNVRIQFDDRDIPHVYAATIEDALYAQGYLHAANRLFAMEATTRSAAGRLSELFGARTLAIDRKQRERGYEHSAIEKAAYWQQFPRNKALLDAYTQGVNDYIHSLKYEDWPFEYKLLSHAPAEWSIVQSALVMTSMAINLCIKENDVEYSTAKQKLSPEDFQFLYPLHNIKESPVIPSEKKWEFSKDRPGASGEDSKQVIGSKASKEKAALNGSNNWAVSGAKTKNGFPILANDPHLNLTLPNIWYEMEFHTPDMHVHGVSLPGLPFIILGFNDAIAWGSTNSGQDVLDWFSITWQDSTRHKYFLDGQLVEATLRPEQIDVRGAHPIIDTIRYTKWGPVSNLDEHKDMAMKWIGHQKATSNDLEYLVKIDKAKNLSDYRDAIESFRYPAQNKVFASVQGDIAISVAGDIPVRANGNGETVTSGDKSASDWQDYIPFNQAPFIINPQRGFVSSANQAPTDTTYPYPLLGRRTFEDYRGRTLNLILDTMQAITPDKFESIQQSNFNLFAAEMLPEMLKALYKSECTPSNSYLDKLISWNYQYNKDQSEPVLFELWYNTFEKMTWDELDSLGLMRPEEWRFIEILRDDPSNKYFDLQSTKDTIENASDIVCAAFMDALSIYLQLPDDQINHWGAYKHSTIPHLARLPNFGLEYISASGGRHILNAMTKSHGPSWRMIVELSNPPKAWVNYPGGQSGDVASPHFKDFVESFFEGKYYEVSLQPDPDNWVYKYEIDITPE
ncbi:MAG TPA: penicillin acylase family protein [Saprospiraceae bacterium]|nr:penicillin acylase family protein [Saprospiraceae bacterium]